MTLPIKDAEPATVARLHELLDLKDAQLSAAEEENSALRRPEAGDVPDRLLRGGNLPGTMHDACFYSEQTGLPVFFVLDESHRYQVSSLRPLKLTAVPRAGQADESRSEGRTPHNRAPGA